MTGRDETRLFAVLLRDSFHERARQSPCDAYVYYGFLQRYADSRHSNCYAVALRLIGDAR